MRLFWRSAFWLLRRFVGLLLLGFSMLYRNRRWWFGPWLHSRYDVLILFRSLDALFWLLPLQARL